MSLEWMNDLLDVDRLAELLQAAAADITMDSATVDRITEAIAHQIEEADYSGDRGTIARAEFLDAARVGEGPIVDVPEEFNGYVVTFWNHKTQGWKTEQFNSIADVMDRGFEEWPNAEDLARDLYEIFGDSVHTITDLDGTVLYYKAVDPTNF